LQPFGRAADAGLWLRLVGGTFLFCLGVSMFRSQPKMQPPPRGVNGLIGAYATTFVLTISNPVTILSFVAIYAGWHVESLQGNYWGAATLTLGVFLGSALWWVGLFIGLTACRERFQIRDVAAIGVVPPPSVERHEDDDRIASLRVRTRERRDHREGWDQKREATGDLTFTADRLLAGGRGG
jgi:hypothetical protein